MLGVNVILVKLSPVPSVPTVTWLVPVAIELPYVIVWSFAVIVTALAVMFAVFVLLVESNV